MVIRVGTRAIFLTVGLLFVQQAFLISGLLLVRAKKHRMKLVERNALSVHDAGIVDLYAGIYATAWIATSIGVVRLFLDSVSMLAVSAMFALIVGGVVGFAPMSQIVVLRTNIRFPVVRYRNPLLLLFTPLAMLLLAALCVGLGLAPW